MNVKNNNISTNEIEKSILYQFAENHKHYQTLFIQFLSSLIIVLVGYAYVYTNTLSYHPPRLPSQITNITRPDSLTEQVYTGDYKIDTSNSTSIIEALTVRPFESIKSKSGSIISYGIIHLISIYIFSQVVLFVLGVILLHLGYSFRRDQVVVSKIRKQRLSNQIESHGVLMSEYEYLYGEGFTGNTKKVFNYLPNFYSVLIGSIFLIKIGLFLSIFIYLNRFPEELILVPGVFNGKSISFYELKILLGVPVLSLPLFYLYYFVKYDTKVKESKWQNVMLLEKVASKDALYVLLWGATILFALKFSLWLGSNNLLYIIAAIPNFTLILISIQYLSKNDSRAWKYLDRRKTLHKGILFGILSCFIGYLAFINLFLTNKKVHLLPDYFELVACGLFFISLVFIMLIKKDKLVPTLSDRMCISLNLLVELVLLLLLILILLFTRLTGLLFIIDMSTLVSCILLVLWSFKNVLIGLGDYLHSKGMMTSDQY